MNGPTRWIVVTLSAGALLWMTVSASAQGGAGRTERGSRIERWAERLELTSDQRAKIDEIEEQGEAARRELRKEERRAEHDLEGELMQDTPNAGRVKDLVEKVGDLRTRLRWLSLEERLEMRNVLTPDQRDRFPLDGRGFDRKHERRSFHDRGSRRHELRRVD